MSSSDLSLHISTEEDPYDLTTLREAAFLTQKYLATKLKIGVSTCRKWERSGDPRLIRAIIDSIEECDCDRSKLLRKVHRMLMLKPNEQKRAVKSVIKGEPRFRSVQLRELYEYLLEREVVLKEENKEAGLEEVRRMLIYLVTNHSSLRR